MQFWIEPVELNGKYARLLPLTSDYYFLLKEAVQDGKLWQLWFTSVPSPEKMESEINRRLELQQKSEMVPFVIVDAVTNIVIGMTSYCRLDQFNRRLEIGYTWYRKSYQKTPVNTECKLMLLKHAFEQLGCIAVEFRTNAYNFDSRRAIERLGARLDGVLRNARLLPDGAVCDSYVYSILASEWSAVRTNLDYKLENYRLKSGN